MKHRFIGRFIAVLPLVALAGQAVLAEDGVALYAQHCARCHDSAVGRAPSREELAQMSKEDILRALEGGSMRAQGARRTPEEREMLAAFQIGRASCRERV